MARRFSAKNTLFTPGPTQHITFLHLLGAVPDEWSLVARTSSHWLVFHTANTTEFEVRSSVKTNTGNSTMRGDVFCWVNHSIVK